MKLADKSIYWYDFETFGRDPRRDRASQFAGIRTDEELNIIGEPLVMYCQPADDFIPSPMSSLITGITPQKAKAEGLREAEFIARIHAEFAQPGTCVTGYNSIRFDDEVTRQLLYRNFYDPYEREWKNGNSRWDIIDMVRLCAATRPEGIEWPKKVDGSNSFRLEELTVANGIEHADAHDALSDVLATIAMAKLIKDKQPKLFEYAYQLRSKQKVQAEIDLQTRKPVLHVSVMYPSSKGCLALVMPICAHPGNSNGVIVYDLRVDPESWVSLSDDEIRQRLFTPSAELEEGVERIPLKTIHYNRSPIVASPAVLPPNRAEHFGVNLDACREHWEKLNAMPQLPRRIANIYRQEQHPGETDPDYMIYSGGFFSENDKQLMQLVRNTQPEDLPRLDLPFNDGRLAEMLFRYRARNYPETLREEEQQAWKEFRRQRLAQPETLKLFEEELAEAEERADAKGAKVLAQLEEYIESLKSTLD